ncbi:hypothetical protein [Thalassotalea ganghwensis]
MIKRTTWLSLLVVVLSASVLPVNSQEIDNEVLLTEMSSDRAKQTAETSAEVKESFWSKVIRKSEDFKQQKCQEEGMYFRCLSGFEPSYFGYVGRDDAHLDGSHLEFKVSMKYPLWGGLDDYGSDQISDLRSSAVYFAYTGLYDFYFGSRYSAPVISRRQNPGVFYQYQYENKPSGYQYFSLGYFHESNGQEIDREQMFDNKVQDLLLRNCTDKGDDCLTDPFQQKRARAMATDYLSRGWDYLRASTKYTITHRRDLLGRRLAIQTDIYFSARVYFNWQGLGFVEGREENIDWLPEIDNSREQIYDFNTYELTLSRKLNSLNCKPATSNRCSTSESRDMQGKDWLDYLADTTDWSVTLITGKDLNHLSYRLDITHHLAGQFPLKLMYFNGYGENISTYQRKSHYWMLGIELW